MFETANAVDVWHLIRVNGSAVDTVARNQTDQTGDPSLSPVVDGIRWRVFGALAGFKSFEVTANGAGPVDPTEIACFAFNESGFPFLFNAQYLNGTDRPDGSRQQTNGSTWGIHTGSTSSFDYEWFKTRVARGDNWSRIVPNDFEIRFTAAGGKAQLSYTTNKIVDVPFELWYIGSGTPNDASDDVRMIPWLYDTDGDDAFNLNKTDHPISGGTDDPQTDWIYFRFPANMAPGQAGYNAWLSSAPATTDAGLEVIARMVLVNWNGGSVSDPAFPQNVDAVMPEPGTIFRITSTKPNTTDDIFTIVAPAVTYDRMMAVADVSEINVFPNPYYAVNPLERDKYYKFVTFSHLPERAILRIFNLGGVMVRKIEKSSTSQFLEWDLKNEGGLPVGSGLYVVHIEMPDLGTSKVLKLAIVQEVQILDRY